jgi:predicted kinase
MISVLLCGLPASGKTFLSKKLVTYFSAMNKGQNVQAVSTLSIRRDHGLFDLHSELQRAEVYRYYNRRIAELTAGNQVDVLILDGNFNKYSRRAALYEVLEDSTRIVIECMTGDFSVVIERLQYRQEHVEVFENKAASIELYELIKKDWMSPESDIEVQEKTVSYLKYVSEEDLLDIVSASAEVLGDPNVQDLLAFFPDQG